MSNTKPEELPWPQPGDQLFVVGQDAENNAWLKWRGDERWAAYAEGYKKAADILVQRVQDTASDQDFLVYPVCFLYRHYLELRLKSLIMVGQQLRRKNLQFPKHHEVWKLWRESRAVLEQTWPDGPKIDLDNVEACIREFADVDRSSITFRYPSAKDGKENLSNVTHISLRNLSQVMGRLASLLDCAFDGMSEMLCIRGQAEDYLR